jgi:hypothetical protein
MGITFSGIKSLGKLWFGVGSKTPNDYFEISYELI